MLLGSRPLPPGRSRARAACPAPKASAAARPGPGLSGWAGRPLGLRRAGQAGARASRPRLKPVRAARIDGVGVVTASQLVADAGYHYLDCRTEEEFAAGHPPGATNLPVFVSGPGGMEPNFDEFVRGVEAAFPDKEANFVVGCRSGVRSLTAGALMQEAGYTGAVLNVEGGFLDWEGRGLEVER